LHHKNSDQVSDISAESVTVTSITEKLHSAKQTEKGQGSLRLAALNVSSVRTACRSFGDYIPAVMQRPNKKGR